MHCPLGWHLSLASLVCYLIQYTIVEMFYSILLSMLFTHAAFLSV